MRLVMSLRYDAPTGPHYLAVVDPGKRIAGLAVFYVEAHEKAYVTRAARLVAVRNVKALPERMAIALQYACHDAINLGIGELLPIVWVSEIPQRYRLRGDASLDCLFDLCAALDSRVGVKKFLLPAEWKGQIAKGPHHRRIVRRLEPSEAALVAAGEEAHTVDHNALDALGIGLYVTGRTERGAANAR